MSHHQSPPQQRPPSQRTASQTQPQNTPPPPPPEQQPPPPQPQQSRDQQLSPTHDAPLHPEIRSIVSLTMAHTQKIYFSGPLVHKFDRNPDGHKPHKDEGWRDVWAQLYGTTLSIWDMGEVKIANQQGKEVPPSYVNVTEAFVHVLGAITQPATATSPSRKYTNVITLNTAGTNLLLFSCPSSQDLISWAAAFRLSGWEKSRLEEIYSAHLIRITLNDGRNTPSTLTHGRLEGWVRVRIAGQTGWKRLWMCISTGMITNAARSSTDVTSISSKSPLVSGQIARHSSYTPQKHRISGLFSREKPRDLPERASISLYAAPRGKDKKKPLLTFDTVTQAFAVYPERPKLISSSTLIKLEGTYGNEDMCANMRHREGWMLLMPDLEGARSVSGEMLKWLTAIHDVFELYGRPKVYSWDPRDSVSMMFAYPIGPEKQLLFLDREAAEALDPREERTPVVRSKLLNIMVERMRTRPGTRTNQNGDGAPQSPPTGGGSLDKNQDQQSGLGSIPSISQLGVLSPEQPRQQQQEKRDNNWAQPPPHPNDRRALTPITERSTRDSNSWDTGGNPPPLQRLGPTSGSPQSDQIQKQQSETSQDLPKLQADTESSTFLGETLVTSPTSHIALHEFGMGRADSAGSLGSKRDSHHSRQESSSLSRPDSKLDTHTSTDAIRPAGGSIGSPLSSPGKESVFSALPSPYSNQPIHPVQSTFSDILNTTLTTPDRPVTPPTRKGPGTDPRAGSPTPSSSSRFRGANQRREAGSPSTSLTATMKAKTPEPTPLPQTDRHPNTSTFSLTPTMINSVPTLTHTATSTSTTSQSEHSGYSNGLRPSPPQQTPGTFSLPNHSNQGTRSHPHSYSTSQSQRTVQDESFQKGSLSTLSGKLGEAKPATRVDEGKEGSGGDHDLIKEAGALYYMQAIQDASAVPPPKIVGRGQNIPAVLRKRSNSDDDDDEEPSTEDEPRSLSQPTQAQPQPRQRLPSEPSPPQVRRPSAQAKASPIPHPPLPVSPPHQLARSSPRPSQDQYQDQGHPHGRDQQPILAPQPQQPVTSSFNSIKTMEGDVRSPNLPHPDDDTNPTSQVVDSRRTSVIGHGRGGGQGGGSRPGQVSRPSGARDLVLKQRGGTSDSVSSHSRHNGQPQPRHSLPPHPESFSEQPPQSSYSTYAPPPRHRGQLFTQTLGETAQQTPQTISTADRNPTNMANVDRRQHYDDNADALAALTFLERDEANAAPKPRPPPQERRDPTSGSEADAYDMPPIHVTSLDSRDDVSQDSGSHEGKYKSSFAPSKQATQRLAKSQAQQAAHQAAVHRPGKSGGANGKGKRRVPQDSWAESSDEEEDEEEDDEDVDSDGDPVAPRRGQGPGAGPGQNFGKLSAQGSPYGSTTDLQQPGQGRSQRHLPRPPSPGRGYGDQDDYYHQQEPGGSGLSTLRRPSGHYPDPTRSQYPDDRRPSPQPHGNNHLRPQSDFPTPGAARQTIWSQALENKDAPKDSGPQRETFVQIEPSHTMTKAFALHGLLSAGLQDRQERSAKRQEEVAKETGASLVNVPMKPPPPQTGLLGAVSAHERERKREGGIGAALTERERERRLAEERQRKLDDFQKQQLEMVQNGSMYGSQFGPGGFNPMMANPMMMGMNPMMGGWGFNPMMANPQMFAAQQAAAQAYQQAMMSFSQNMGQSQTGGEGLGGMGGGMGGMGSPGMLSPMATGQQGLNPMMTGQFDPRMSMMGMPMMGMMGMGMGGMSPMNPMMTGQSGMGPGMGGMGVGTGTGGGLAMQMTGVSTFDPRMSPSQFDLSGNGNPSPTQGSPSGPRPLDAPLPSRSPANASPGPK